MNGCIYRTKDNECDLYAEGGKYQAFCDFENCKDRRQSNADHIRSMSDEELADFLCDISGGESCIYCVASDLCHNGHNGMIEWLKEEAKGDTDEDKA